MDRSSLLSSPLNAIVPLDVTPFVFPSMIANAKESRQSAYWVLKYF
jgi:hypothetical protein